jgi:hypothetical protein
MSTAPINNPKDNKPIRFGEPEDLCDPEKIKYNITSSRRPPIIHASILFFLFKKEV